MVCPLIAALLIALTVAQAAQRTADSLAAELAIASTAAEREALLAAEPDLVNTAVVVALGRIASSAVMMQQYRRAQTLYEYVVELAHRTGSRKEQGEGGWDSASRVLRFGF